MLRKSTIILFVAIIFFGGCKKSPSKDDAGAVMGLMENRFPSIIVDDVPPNGTFNVEDIFDSVSFVRLSNEPKATLGGIDQIIVKDSLIIIRDEKSTKSIKIFSSDGDFIRNIGSLGRGPGE